MARSFTVASSEKIVLSIGALGFALGPGTVAALIRPLATSGACLAAGTTTSTTTRWGFGHNAIVYARFGNSSIVAPTAVITAGEWGVCAVTKAAGTVAPRWYAYKYSNDTWTIENHGSTVASSGVPATSAYIGSRASGDQEFFGGDIAVVAAWDVVLSDDQIKSLPYGLMPWFALQPKGLFILDQDAVTQKIIDLTGNGANESARNGTAVATSSVPVFSYGAPVMSVNGYSAVQVSDVFPSRSRRRRVVYR